MVQRHLDQQVTVGNRLSGGEPIFILHLLETSLDTLDIKDMFSLKFIYLSTVTPFLIKFKKSRTT